ncbi:MAG TPA: 50S ribosomal protein L28 [Actinomycetota bacterium]|nr:50S ribosomal protein L28 [Actinomycetota bacterium]
MSKVCDVCGKSPVFGKSISHSHRRSNRRWSPNIQIVRTVVGGTPRKLRVCTSCISANKVPRA